MRNIGLDKLDKKDVEHFTTDVGLKLRKKFDKSFKKLCNIFTNANIIKIENQEYVSDDDYFNMLDITRIPLSNYDIKRGKNNIIVERYPQLEIDEPYIFVCNHTCPEDIETVLNVLDRNAYLVLGSIETLKYNPEMYLTWLNGMIPFDILDNNQRKALLLKMERVLKTNSILIFPEGSHNYSPNKLINNLFDGPINLSLKTGRKIVVVTLIRDKDNDVSYIDVSNPVELDSFGVKKDYKYSTESEIEKYYVKSLTSCIRDKMATAVYYMILRHFDAVNREDFSDIEEYFREQYVKDAFKSLKWKHDVFEAEYLVKKTIEEKTYEEVIHTISNLKLSPTVLKNTRLCHRSYVLQEIDLQQKNVAQVMRAYWLKNQTSNQNQKKLVKRK